MSLTLYGAPLSPFVRKVRLLLAEKGLDYQLEAIAPFGQPAWYREISPLGRIPALRDGDLALADSSVICQYLEERYPEPPNLQGDAPASRAAVRWLEKYADYEIAPLATLTIFRNRILKPAMGQACEENDVRRALEEKLPAHFDYLEKPSRRPGLLRRRATDPRRPGDRQPVGQPASRRRKPGRATLAGPRRAFRADARTPGDASAAAGGTTDPRQARSESLNASLSSPSGAGISPPGLRSRPGPRR